MLERGMPPVHPGEILKYECMEPLGLSVTATAKALGATRNAISEIINGRRGISPEMALKLAKAFNTTPEVWNNLQNRYDLWQAKQNIGDKLKKIKPLTPRPAM